MERCEEWVDDVIGKIREKMEWVSEKNKDKIPSLEEGKCYKEGALRILKAIACSRANFGRDCDAIVQNCSSAYHVPLHHITMSYADYFFIEAMYKLKGVGRFMW